VLAVPHNGDWKRNCHTSHIENDSHYHRPIVQAETKLHSQPYKNSSEDKDSDKWRENNMQPHILLLMAFVVDYATWKSMLEDFGALELEHSVRISEGGHKQALSL
jgi:hypothetical protein